MRHLIRINTDCTVEALDFPRGTIRQQNDALQQLIGCDILERVRPERLYSVLKAPYEIDPERPGAAVSMLVDEEFMLRNPLPRANAIASWLYGYDVHGAPILGNALIVGECIDSEGEIDFCGIDEKVGISLMTSLFNTAQKFSALRVFHGGTQ